jgi:hypothetical protein
MGHVSGSTIIIDQIAPGYTDTYGSAVGDVVVIKPNTWWADTLVNGVKSMQTQINNQNGYALLTTTPTAVTYNGNRSYDLTMPSDVTGTLSPGMRFRTTRNTAAPTQSTSLNGTTQYFSKTSPAGMTFTNNFVAGGWVKLLSYPSTADAGVIGRYTGASGGWYMSITSAGQIQLVGFSGSSANASLIKSYQSIPLNKWVHISAQLDMASFTNTPTTSYVTIDGVDVPAAVSRFGTNPTSLTQAGNLEIGTYGGGTNPLNAKIAQAFVTSAKLTQTQVKAIYSQGITTADTATYNMVSAYSFNNSINDLNTTNANNLTANGAAVATNADSPFGGQAGGTISSTLDYGIIQKVTASTITVQVAEGCTIPTSGGVASVSYATDKSPYGFPGQRGKWDIDVINIAGYAIATGTSNTHFKYIITVPLGSWNLGYNMNFTESLGGSGVINGRVGLDTAAATALSVSNPFTSQGTAVSLAEYYPNLSRFHEVDLSAATTYYLNGTPIGASFTSFGVSGTYGYIRAENAYL